MEEDLWLDEHLYLIMVERQYIREPGPVHRRLGLDDKSLLHVENVRERSSNVTAGLTWNGGKPDYFVYSGSSIIRTIFYSPWELELWSFHCISKPAPPSVACSVWHHSKHWIKFVTCHGLSPPSSLSQLIQNNTVTDMRTNFLRVSSVPTSSQTSQFVLFNISENIENKKYYVELYLQI